MIENPTKKVTKFALAFAIVLSATYHLPSVAMADDLSMSGDGDVDGGGEGLDGDEDGDDGLVSTSSGDECGSSVENSRC